MVSDGGLQCLSMSHKKEAKLDWASTLDFGIYCIREQERHR